MTTEAYLKTLALHRALMRAELHGKAGSAAQYTALLRYMQARLAMLENMPADEGGGDMLHEIVQADIVNTTHAVQLVQQFIRDCT